VEGVEGEDGGHECARRRGPGHPQEREEEQHRAGRVQSDVREVVTGGLEAVQSVVDQERNPGERDPVAVMRCRERPGHGVEAQALVQHLALDDVERVVLVDELVAVNLRVDRQRGCDECNADDERVPQGQGHLPGL
jgi:hypothetical protein